MQKTRSFTKVTEFDAAGKKSVYFKRATEDSSASKVATAGVTAGASFDLLLISREAPDRAA